MRSVNEIDVIYTAVVHRDELTVGTSWLMAEHPELPGCMSDGPTESEALNNLADPRAEYIESLFTDGLPVP